MGCSRPFCGKDWGHPHLRRSRPLQPASSDPNRPFTFGYVGSIAPGICSRKRWLYSAPSKSAAGCQDAGRQPQRARAHSNDGAGSRAHIGRCRTRRGGASRSALADRAHARWRRAHQALLFQDCERADKTGRVSGCGVPCLGNINVGDMEEILEGREVGVAMRDFRPEDIENAATLAGTCRR